MTPAALLDQATTLVREVLRFEHPADAVVSTHMRQNKQLGARERQTLADTVYALLRQRLLWQHLASHTEVRLPSKAETAKGTRPTATKGAARERRLAALAWQGNPSFLHAALAADERRWLTEVLAIDRATLPDRLRHNQPDWLAESLQAQLGEAGFWALCAELDQPAPLDLRVNTLKAKRDEALAALTAAEITAEPTPFSPLGLRVKGKPSLSQVQAFIDGWVEVQDEGSQLLATLVDAKRGEMVVDFCAGGGGKTLALGAAMRNTGRLYAFDTSGHRLAGLKPRLARSGLSNVYPVQIAHERDDRIKRLAGKVDRVLVDAPCSGLGTLRRHPDLKWRQSPAQLAELQAQQLAILTSAARLLKPGGRLVYATCSLMPGENEDVAAAFGQAQAAHFTALPAAEALRQARVERVDELVVGDHLRLWPHLHKTDGFFAAMWQRR